MNCVCVRDCFIANPQGKNQHYSRGDVVEFDACPDHFRPVKGQGIDFATAGQQELLAADYKLKDLRAYIESKYGRKPGNRGKEKLVDMLLDCRYRHLDIDPNTMV